MCDSGFLASRTPDAILANLLSKVVDPLGVRAAPTRVNVLEIAEKDVLFENPGAKSDVSKFLVRKPPVPWWDQLTSSLAILLQ